MNQPLLDTPSASVETVPTPQAAASPARPQRVTAPLNTLNLHRGQAVALIDGRTGLILEVIGTGQAFMVFSDGETRPWPGTLSAEEITDPTTVLSLTRQALDHTSAAGRAADVRVTELETAAEQTRRAHRERLAEIRAYAIDRHRAGDICRPGLDEFLAHFDLGAYRPRHVVTFTLTGRLEVDPEDGDHVGHTEDLVRDHLRVDAYDIDGVVDGSVDFTTDASVTEGETL